MACKKLISKNFENDQKFHLTDKQNDILVICILITKKMEFSDSGGEWVICLHFPTDWWRSHTNVLA